MYPSKRFTRTKYCPSCGRPVYTQAFDGYCDSGCVEIAVDLHIERKHEQREWEQDREDRERDRYGY